jgi:LuxR family maltose regulon positive regulatory protein
VVDVAGRSPEQAGARASNGVLTTKLHVPRPSLGFLPRLRLVSQLDEGLARGMTLISAPAGFGKTILLADWIQRRLPPVAWLSLDAGDNDPTRFWRHAASALDRVVPGIIDQVASLLGSLAPSWDGFVSALINELVAQPGEVLLVLDDYHLIESPLVHASLTFLLEHRPPRLHLVLASRADPPLPLARLRARGQLTELRAADLRFTTEEVRAFLRVAVGSDLPEAAAEALAKRTEGWAAGLQLAALSLQGQPDVLEFVASFSGRHRYVLDYLTEEVLDRQTEQVREFLLETSVLERLSGELCDAVTGRTDGQRMLEAIERANLFLVPLDEARGWWRYHHLFAELLLVRLQLERPERVPLLHRTAASWHDAHGLVDDAIRHAVAAGDLGGVTRLIERHFDALVLRSEGATVQRWIASLPAELIGSRPRLLLGQARLALLSGRVETVEDLLDAAERAFPDAADEPYEPSVGRAASLLVNIPALIALARAILAELQGNAEGTIEFASRALAQIDEGEWALETITRGHLAVADWLRGRLSEAERAFAFHIAQLRAAGEPNLAAWSCHYLGQVQRAQGRLDAALMTYQHALEVAAPPDRPALPAAGVGYVGMAEVAYQWGELDVALRHANDGIPLCQQLAYTQPLAFGLATLAWIWHAKGDVDGALDAIEEAERVAPSPAVANLLNTVPAQRARLLLAQGDVGGVDRWITERGLGADDEPSYPREPEYLVLARVLLAHGRPEEALRLLGRLHALASAQQRTGSVIEIQALQALALAASGDETAAVAVLAEALTLAAPQGYVRVFVEEGRPMSGLLGRLVAAHRTDQAVAHVPLNYLGRLVQAIDRDAARTTPRESSGTVVVPGLVAALTERELEVLHLLAAGRQNREIADELYVALDTVKKHVTHILDKLGASNRTEATARARDLGLLS